MNENKEHKFIIDTNKHGIRRERWAAGIKTVKAFRKKHNKNKANK